MLSFADHYKLEIDYLIDADLRQKSSKILIWRNIFSSVAVKYSFCDRI